jgi:hypothetical protein
MMKLKTLGMLAGLALLLPSAAALAHTDVRVDLGFGLPPPPAVVVEERPYYYEYEPRVYYYDDGYWHPRRYYYAPRAHGYRHDNGEHRGWRHHRRHDDD